MSQILVTNKAVQDSLTIPEKQQRNSSPNAAEKAQAYSKFRAERIAHDSQSCSNEFSRTAFASVPAILSKSILRMAYLLLACVSKTLPFPRRILSPRAKDPDHEEETRSVEHYPRGGLRIRPMPQSWAGIDSPDPDTSTFRI